MSSTPVYSQQQSQKSRSTHSRCLNLSDYEFVINGFELILEKYAELSQFSQKKMVALPLSPPFRFY